VGGHITMQLKALLAPFANIDPLSLVLGALLGALLGTWHSHFVKRPKLKAIGSGSGGCVYLSIQNTPGFLGISLRPTILFGWRALGQIELGLPVDRAPARDCAAWLHDDQTGEIVKGLYWQIPETGEIVRTVTLETACVANVITMTRQGADPGKFFVWQPDETGDAPLVPPPVAQLEGARNFHIEVSYAHGRKKVRFPFRVVRDFDGNYRYFGGSGSAGF
jgi:hypothetical protein